VSSERNLEVVTKAAFEKKGIDIIALNVSKLVYYADYFVIVSGVNDRHVAAIWKNINRATNDAGIPGTTIEGQDYNRGVLVDLGTVVVHIFVDELRRVYELERLWAEAPQVDLDLPERQAALDETDLED